MTNINLKNFDIYVAEGYKVTAQLPEIGKKYYNPLEDVEYVTNNEDTDKVLLVGTVNEPWFAPINKVLKQYSKVDGTDLTYSDITSEPISIVRKTSYNAAMELTEDTDVVISAGNVLHAKEGDYLVCSVKEEQGIMVPDDQWGYWTINRKVFYKTNKKIGGYCGENAQWFYNQSEKTLIISGYGETYDYELIVLSRPTALDPYDSYRTSFNASPFWGYMYEVKNVVIGDKITKIGKGCFRYAEGRIDSPCFVISLPKHFKSSEIYCGGDRTWNGIDTSHPHIIDDNRLIYRD